VLTADLYISKFASNMQLDIFLNTVANLIISHDFSRLLSFSHYFSIFYYYNRTNPARPRKSYCPAAI